MMLPSDYAISKITISSSFGFVVTGKRLFTSTRVLRLRFLALLNGHLVDYPTPLVLTYFWGFGSVAGLFLALQICTGLFLAFHYTAGTQVAFDLMEHVLREVNSGWFLRFLHSNGASFFFIAVYLHLSRAFLYGSFFWPRYLLWISGVIIFLLMMAVAFMGYVLPWGQMSFWGATVITSLFSAFPFIGESISMWLWGGFAVDNPTLNRFFGFHFIVPFILLAVVIGHLVLLHSVGSFDPLLGQLKQDRIAFYPYFYVKDLLGFLIFLGFFLFFVFFYPDTLGHPDNYLEADPLVTPQHIVPEWYFLPFYAMLRSVPNKLGGVICMFAAIIVLFFAPWVCYRQTFAHVTYNIFWNLFILLFFFSFLALGWVGGQPVEVVFIILGQFLTLCYFASVLFLFFASLMLVL